MNRGDILMRLNRSVGIFCRTFSQDNTVEDHSSILPNPNALVAVSKGMHTVKLCTNKILQFLTGGAG